MTPTAATVARLAAVARDPLDRGSPRTCPPALAAELAALRARDARPVEPPPDVWDAVCEAIEAWEREPGPAQAAEWERVVDAARHPLGSMPDLWAEPEPVALPSWGWGRLVLALLLAGALTGAGAWIVGRALAQAAGDALAAQGMGGW